MKIGLIDNDFVSRKNHNFPNLALMKLSAFYKQRGDDVRLIGLNEIDPNTLFPGNFDHIFISKAFTDSYTPQYVNKLTNVTCGGTGFYFDKAQPLSHEIEHSFPDYSLYDTVLGEIKKKTFFVDYSIGYTSRGCFRHCEFCVNKNSSHVSLHSPIDEFYDPMRKKIAMLDDNVLGLPNRELYKIFDRLGEINKPFQYRQALDIRLLTEERIRKLFELPYDGNYYFAFDLWENRDVIEPKMRLFYELYMKIKRTDRQTNKFIQSRMYLFTGMDISGKYDESFWLNDLEILFKRIEICIKYGFCPYVMRYETVDKSRYRKIYQNICQWTNHPSVIIGVATWEEFLADDSFSTKETKIFFDNHKEFFKYMNLTLRG